MTNYVKATDFASKDTLVSGDPNKVVKGTEINTEFSNIQTAVNSKADLLSPTLTGTPLAPTAAVGTNTTQIATTAYVIGERTSTATLTNKTLESPVLTGSPTAPTPTAGDNDTSVATTAFVTTAVTNERTATATLTNKSLTSPALTGTPTTPTAAFGTNSTQVASTAFVQAALQAVYPVGSIYISTSATNPGTTFGFGTWAAFGAGKVLVGQDTGDAAFDTLEETGGSKDAIVVSHTHTATVNDPGHTHSITASGTQAVAYGSGGDLAANDASGNTGSKVTGITVTNSTAGSSGTNANLQPYVVVKMWKRTA